MLTRVKWAVEVLSILMDAVPKRSRRERNALTVALLENPADDPDWTKYHTSRQYGR